MMCMYGMCACLRVWLWAWSCHCTRRAQRTILGVSLYFPPGLRKGLFVVQHSIRRVSQDGPVSASCPCRSAVILNAHCHPGILLGSWGLELRSLHLHKCFPIEPPPQPKTISLLELIFGKYTTFLQQYLVATATSLNAINYTYCGL